MSLVKGLAHIGLRVHELARSRAFYELLEFQFVAGPLGPEPVAILQHPSGLELNLILNAAPSSNQNVLMDVVEKHAGYTHFALLVSSIEEAQERLAAAGFSLSGGPMTHPDGTRAIFVRDPDRNVVELDQKA
ncbi:MAG TPA: VOC family protein [Polyangiaceae bacterium]|jgi:lactoylglutathione lyase